MRAAIAVLLVLPLLAEEPGARVRGRGAADAERLFPQTGLGGDDASKLEPDATTWSEVKIGAPGCEKMTGYVSVPSKLDPARKCALFFMFHGNGDVGQHRVRHHARITTSRDPVIVIGVQYQELKADGGGQMGLPTLAKPEEVIAGCRWLLDKVMKEHPVDPERVFVGGFSWGTAWASGWCEQEWQENRDAFPFRACFLYGSGGAGTKTSLPPIPWIAMVGEEETAVLGTINVVESVRHYCNVVRTWGHAVQYHEIPKMGHQVNDRCLQITRDLVNRLGGPAPAGPAAEPLPFPAPSDPYVVEVRALCDSDRWKDARDRLREIEADRKITLKDKKAALAFRTDIDKFAQGEATRLEKLLTQCVKEGKAPNPLQIRRLKGLLEGYEAFPWAKKPAYADCLKPFTDDYPPFAREREREKLFRDAWDLETQEGKRSDAKPLYEALAARGDEDGGASPWPRAAAWRLKWWMDGKK